MKIKDAELLTGLSAKTIRFYESEGLICVKTNSNTYREYDEKNIDELRRIKILRKLDLPISKIKELNDGKTSLHDIFQAELKKLDENQLNLELKKSTIKVILKELNKNPNVDLIEYSKEFEYIHSDEFTELLCEIKELGQVSLSKQILSTLILSGPLLWLFNNISNRNYEFIAIESILSIISTVLLTLAWSRFLKQTNKKIKGTGSMLLSILIVVVLSLTIFVGITKLQKVIFVPRDYLMFMFKPPYSYIFLLFEVEILVVFISKLYKKIKNVEWKWASELFSFVRKNIVATVILNIILLYVCVTGITVVTKNKIIDYNFYNPTGTTYSYNDICKVQTGFKGKLFNIFKGHAGDFYYIVSFKDGNKINFYQANSAFEDSYLELEIFDELIMGTGKAQKSLSSNNYQFCHFDQRYVDRFLKIIENR
ncbi:MerR family transcriptional regulator [Clostridium tetani]|uniref:MerR family transcriptional regulator n=1 Tax=Clostridium tetani TaxID=1513 RepID=A0ABY0EQC5_CLOTA|nr:MerR family transcriptional regulator [Clostridium tetani]KHO39469.1 MerR family transcriptional regulator [Clostridium tetani]RXI53074.1 MerR family transcriptional regulator [Clostridium tetani]RXI67347.1 MerR family transcriptional regulator [Clostridium tetani]CDI49271.1 transcriptional regulator, MerR family protein [Clostridium tetani 12124569]